MCSPLHKAFQQAVQHVATVAHEAHILRRAVHTLPVQNWPLKHVAELLSRAQKVRPDKVHHTPVLDEVVLQWVAGQDNAAPRADVLQGLRRVGVAVLDAVALVADHHIGARPGDGSLYTWRYRMEIQYLSILEAKNGDTISLYTWR